MGQLKKQSQWVHGTEDRIKIVEGVGMTQMFQIQNSDIYPELGVIFTIGNLHDTTETERNVTDERSQHTPRSLVTTVAEKNRSAQG